MYCTANSSVIHSFTHEREDGGADVRCCIFSVLSSPAHLALSPHLPPSPLSLSPFLSPLLLCVFVSLIKSLESSSVCSSKPKNYWHELCDNCINIHKPSSSPARRPNHSRHDSHRIRQNELVFFGTFFIPSNLLKAIHIINIYFCCFALYVQVGVCVCKCARTLPSE